jgi:hypothetical protein
VNAAATTTASASASGGVRCRMIDALRGCSCLAVVFTTPARAVT